MIYVCDEVGRKDQAKSDFFFIILHQCFMIIKNIQFFSLLPTPLNGTCVSGWFFTSDDDVDADDDDCRWDASEGDLEVDVDEGVLVIPFSMSSSSSIGISIKPPFKITFFVRLRGRNKKIHEMKRKMRIHKKKGEKKKKKRENQKFGILLSCFLPRSTLRSFQVSGTFPTFF